MSIAAAVASMFGDPVQEKMRLGGGGGTFDLHSRKFGQTTKWDGNQLIVISAFWDAALQRQQIGLAQ